MIAWTIWYKAAGHDPWHPLEPYRSLPVGHYYLAARFPQQGQHLEWRWKYFAPDGSHQTYNFQGQTNPEGLISLLDLETVQSGTWQLTLRPDVFAELCGETWHVKHQFQIIPRPALIIPPSTVVTATETNQIVPYASQPVAVTTPPIPLVEASSEYASLAQSVDAEISPQCDSPATLNLEPLPSGGEPIEPLASEPAPPPTRPFPDFAPASSQQEFSSAELDDSHRHPVHYSLELVYPEAHHSPLHVDITVMTDDRYPPIKLDLPNPNQNHKRLWRTFPKRRSPLPPKLI